MGPWWNLELQVALGISSFNPTWMGILGLGSEIRGVSCSWGARRWAVQPGHRMRPEHLAGEVCGSQRGCAHTRVCLWKGVRKREPAWPEPLEPDPEALGQASGVVAGPPTASEAAVGTRPWAWSRGPSSVSSRRP